MSDTTSRTPDELFRDNVWMLAKRIIRTKKIELAEHIVRLCEERGAKANFLRREEPGRWVEASEYTEIQLAHIRAYEPHRWRVDDDCLGYVWESYEPATPVPPHTAGEEDTTKLRTEFTNTLGEYLNAWTGYKEHPCAECSQRVTIAHDRLWRMVSPAASQATPEMPEWVLHRVKEARDNYEKTGFLGQLAYGWQAAVLVLHRIADRVSELERENTALQAKNAELERDLQAKHRFIARLSDNLITFQALVAVLSHPAEGDHAH